MSAKAELSDLQYEQQREMEGLLDSIRSLTRELKLQETIIDAFIPHQYQASHRLSFISPFILHRIHLPSSILPLCFYFPSLWTSIQFVFSFSTCSSFISHSLHFDFMPTLSSLHDNFQYWLISFVLGHPQGLHICSDTMV